MFKVTPCFPNKTKDNYASTGTLMSMSMSCFNPKIQYNRNLEKNPFKTMNVSPFKNLHQVSKLERLERTSMPKKKSCFNSILMKDTFYQIEDQNCAKKSKNAFRINMKKGSLDLMIFDKRRKLRGHKNDQSPQVLKSSNLSDIYSRLYESYERVPFQECEGQQQMIKQEQIFLNEIKKVEQKQKKVRKQFQVKNLQWQNNLRKQIKCLTKDTDNILSQQFRDIRDVGRR